MRFRILLQPPYRNLYLGANMTPQEAFKILEEATARLQLTRADHVIIVKALEAIKQKIEEK